MSGVWLIWSAHCVEADHKLFRQAELSSKKSRKGSNDQQQHQRKNTSVYVTNIPRDATYDEVVDLFSRYGILAESLDTGEKRVKLYTDENGNFKGEALVIYFREESVPLAIQMLDDSDFRLGRQDPSGRIKVSKADFSHKATHQQDNNAHKSRTEKDKLKGRHKYMKMSRYGVWTCGSDGGTCLRGDEQQTCGLGR